jgi:EpsI family protein
MQALVIGAAALLLASPVAIAHRADSAVLSGVPKLHPPLALATLPAAGAELPAWEPNYSSQAATLHRTVLLGGRPAGIYIGYYRQQDARGKMLSSVNVLANSNSRWRVVSAMERSAEISGQQTSVSRFTLRRRDALTDEPGLVVWRTHWVGDDFEADPFLARLRAAMQRLAGRGDDAAVILLYTVEGPAADATL